ncbi:MAG: transposase [Rhodobacteraceae bacterium]|nr:transposase [Paracoccaceae bacterium]
MSVLLSGKPGAVQNTDTASFALLAGEAGFDPIEDRLRANVRATIEAVFEEELALFLGRLRYGRGDGLAKGYRHGHRERQLAGTFGTETVRVPRARIEDDTGKVTEWRSKALPRYQRLTKKAAPGTGKTQTARLWAYARDERPWGGEAPPASWYRFSPDRKGEHPKDHLARFRGWMHADGYAGFENLYRSGSIREVACLAHVRRKFVDIHRSQGSPIAEEAIGRIAQLYAVEKEAEGRHRMSGSNFARHMRPRSSTIRNDGWPCNSPRSRENPRSPPPSAMP